MHRQFLSLRDKVTGSDDQSVIAEVDRGETYLDEKWQAALNDNPAGNQDERTPVVIVRPTQPIRETRRG